MSAASGLLQGIQAGNMLVDAYYRGQENKDRSEIKNVMAEGLESAKAQRQGAIDANVKVGSEANADNTMTMPTFADAKGAKFGSEAEARGSAEKSAPSVDDFYVKNVVPKIAETYLKQGNMEQAEKWNSWAQEKNTKTGMKHWTKALQAGQMGDFKSYADNMVKAYNAPGYYDDGLEADGYDLVKDKEGNTTGMTLNLRNKSTGEKFSQTIRSQEDMVKMGIGLLDPANAFKTTQAAVAAQKASQAKSDEGNLKFQRDVYRDDRKGERQSALQSQRDESAIDRLTTGKQLDAVNKKQEIELKTAAGQLFKRGASPEEAKRMLVTTMAKQYVSAIGKPTKTAEEIGALADQYIQQIYGEKQGNPMSGGMLPQEDNPQPAKGPLMFYDRNTGKMVPDPR